MNRGGGVVRGAGLFLLVAGSALTGCSYDDDGHHIVPAGGATLVGFSDTLPKIDGTWRFVDTQTANGCGSISALVADATAVQIAQAHTELQIETLNVCGNRIAIMEGALTPANVISASSRRTVFLTDTCSLEFKVSLAGTANDLGNHIEGSASLKITPVDGPLVDCGPGYPCQIDSTFVADRCPPADCTFQSCSSS
jgi:hypothetical protein